MGHDGDTVGECQDETRRNQHNRQWTKKSPNGLRRNLRLHVHKTLAMFHLVIFESSGKAGEDHVPGKQLYLGLKKRVWPRDRREADVQQLWQQPPWEGERWQGGPKEEKEAKAAREARDGPRKGISNAHGIDAMANLNTSAETVPSERRDSAPDRHARTHPLTLGWIVRSRLGKPAPTTTTATATTATNKTGIGRRSGVEEAEKDGTAKTTVKGNRIKPEATWI